MNVVLMSGLPRSGKTTSRETFTKYLEDNGINYYVIENTNRRTRKDDAVQLIAAQLYQAIMERKSDTLIIEGPFMNVFDREVILEKLDDVMGIKDGLTANLIVIQHNRSNRFVFEHNKLGNDRTAYPDKVIVTALNSYQQPVREEGFNLIYNVNGDRYLDMVKLSGMLHKLDAEFPVLTEEEESKDEAQG